MKVWRRQRHQHLLVSIKADVNKHSKSRKHHQIRNQNRRHVVALWRSSMESRMQRRENIIWRALRALAPRNEKQSRRKRKKQSSRRNREEIMARRRKHQRKAKASWRRKAEMARRNENVRQRKTKWRRHHGASKAAISSNEIWAMKK